MQAKHYSPPAVFPILKMIVKSQPYAVREYVIGKAQRSVRDRERPCQVGEDEEPFQYGLKRERNEQIWGSVSEWLLASDLSLRTPRMADLQASLIQLPSPTTLEDLLSIPHC